jgi:hypothetical protein
MSEISALEQRLSIALTRISAATEIIVSSSHLEMNAPETVNRDVLPAHISKELEQLRLSLMQSQTTNAQQATVIDDLNTKITNLSSEQPRPHEADNEHGLAKLSQAVLTLDASVQQLSQSNLQLRKANQDLRSANAAGLADPGVVDAGLQAELLSLHAERDVDKAQLQALFSVLVDSNRETASA